MINTNPKVDEFINKEKKWKNELIKFRALVLDSGLKEDVKWGVPCYTLNDKNVIIIHGFKEYCGLMFLKGAIMKDPSGILIQQTENVQAARQIRVKNVQDILDIEPTLKAYIDEAIEIEKAGLVVPLKDNTDLKLPEEFQKKLEEVFGLKEAFESLTPGRQRAYNFYFSAPKQSKTRESRIENYLEKILEGKGLYD